MRKKGLVIFFLALLATPSVYAKDICTTYLTPTQSYVSLMKNGDLLQQRDDSLRRRRLILKNGGLCTSTCGINVLHALLKILERHLIKPAAVYLELMLEYIKLEHGVDGRKGLTFEQLRTGIRFLANGIHLPIQMTIEPYKLTHQLVAAHDEILLVMLVDEDSHVVVLTGQDDAMTEVFFSDPISPNEMQTVPTSMFREYVKEVMRIRFNLDFRE